MRKPTKALVAILLCGAVSVDADVVRTRGGATGAATAVTPGTTTVTGCQNRVIYGDNSSVLNCEAALGYTASTDTLAPTIIQIPAGAPNANSIHFGTPGTGIYSAAAASMVSFAAGGSEYFRVQANDVQVFGNFLNLGASTQVRHQVLGLTASTMTVSIQAQQRIATHSYTWSNAQVVALGATTTGDINVATLPAKTEVLRALVVITGTAAGTTTLTVQCGDATVGAPFNNYILAGSAQAAVNTVYGDVISGAETGASLFDATAKWIPAFLPSYTATTLVTCRFISTGANLSAVTGSTGTVILTTRLLP